MKYYIEKEERLSKLTERLGITSGQLRKLNPQMKILGGLSGGIYVQADQTLNLPADAKMPAVVSTSGNTRSTQANEEERKKLLEKLEFNEKARYRGEQNIITKFNSIVQTTVDTKREYLVSKTNVAGTTYVKIELVEDIMKSYPESLAEATKLFTDIDLIKCKTTVSVDANGKIQNVLNHSEIIDEWEKHKQKILTEYGFLRMPNAKENLNKFIAIQDQTILNEENLIRDLQTKMFFNVFFNPYLVKKVAVEQSQEKTFYSPLFDEQKMVYKLNESMVGESEEVVKIRKVTEDKPLKLDKNAILKSYDQKFKPYIGYGFSEHNFSYLETADYNEKEKWVENANVSIIEEVKNNVELLINYKLKKIKV